MRFVVSFLFLLIFVDSSFSDEIFKDIMNRNRYISQRMLVSENVDDAIKYWTSEYIRFNLTQLHPYPIWIEQPTDWSTKKYNISKMAEYNAKMYWRFFSLMRHKATIATSCWNRNTSVFTSMTIVQIYYFNDEPYRIPCYICEKRMERDGRPKVFYHIPSRNIFATSFTDRSKKQFYNLQEEVYRSLMYKSELAYINKHMDDYKRVSGIDWQMEQSFARNKGGDGLYMSPIASNKTIHISGSTRELTINQYGTFFCLNEKASPNDTPSVIVNVDMLGYGQTRHYELQLEDFKTKDFPDEQMEDYYNLVCRIVWEPWSCPSVCDDKDKTKKFRRYSRGVPSIFKIDPDKPLKGIENEELKRYWEQYRAVDAYLSTSPYRENGIPLYSTLWLSFTTEHALKQPIRDYFVGKWKNFIYINSTKVSSTCQEKLACEKAEKESREITLADDQSEDKKQPKSVDAGVKEEGCPIDLLKHETIFIALKKGEKKELTANKAYKFICGSDKQAGSLGDIKWKVGQKNSDRCTKNYTVFHYKNILHVHRAQADSRYQDYACYTVIKGQLQKYAEMSVLYSIPFDIRPFIVTILFCAATLFLTCPLCAWCAGTVRRVTNKANDLAKEYLAAVIEGVAAAGGAIRGPSGMAAAVGANLVQNQLQKNVDNKMKQRSQEKLDRKAAVKKGARK